MMKTIIRHFYTVMALFCAVIMIIIEVICLNDVFQNEEIIQKQRITIFKLKEQNEILRCQLQELTTYQVDVSFYTLSKRETDSTPDRNALNLKPKIGRDIAVSRDLIHLLGKWVYIEGFGVKYVADVMNERYAKTVDILIGNKKHALKLGRIKNVKLIVLTNYLN